jgi:hypothetical protein
MKITDANGTELIINVDSHNATIDISIDDSPTVELDLPTVIQLLPSLTAAKEALIEVTNTRRKMKLDHLKEQVVALQTEIAEIEALP